MLALLSVVWAAVSSGWGSRLAHAREAVGRFGNGQAAIAVVVGIVLVAVGIGCALAAWHISATATEARDAHWKLALERERAAGLTRQMARDRAAARAADTERATLAKEAEKHAEKAAELETALAKLKDDPVVFPRSLTRSLNR